MCIGALKIIFTDISNTIFQSISRSNMCYGLSLFAYSKTISQRKLTHQIINHGLTESIYMCMQNIIHYTKVDCLAKYIYNTNIYIVIFISVFWVKYSIKRNLIIGNHMLRER